MDKQRFVDKNEDTIMRFVLFFSKSSCLNRGTTSTLTLSDRLELGFDPAEGKSESAKREKSLSVVS